MNMLRNQGFTVIELVVVIILLGILAAFAVPRFAQLGQDARIAAVNGLAGSVRSAAALAHSVSQVKQLDGMTAITMSGQTVTMFNGYPSASAGGITSATRNIPKNFTPTYFNGVARYNANGASDPQTCQVMYAPSTAQNVIPVVTINTTGC